MLWFSAATVVKFHWWKWCSIVPDLGGWVQCSAKFCWEWHKFITGVLCQEKPAKLPGLVPSPRLCGGHPRWLYPALALLSLRTWAGRMGGEGSKSPSRVWKQRPLFASGPPPPTVSCLHSGQGWCSPLPLLSLHLDQPAVPSFSAPGVPSNSSRFFCFPGSFYLPHLNPLSFCLPPTSKPRKTLPSFLLVHRRPKQ